MARKSDPEPLIRAVLALLLLMALAVGGLAHLASVFLALVVGLLILAAIVGGVFVVWKSRMRDITKGAVTLAIGGLILLGYWRAIPDPRYLVFSILALVGAAGLGFVSWQHRDEIPSYFASGPSPVGAWAQLNPYTAREAPRLPESEPAPSQTPAPPPVSSRWQHPPRRAANRTVERKTNNRADALRAIDWYQFEKLIARLLTCEGFQITRQGGAKADGGVDLIAERDGIKTAVQCKHWQRWRIKEATIREMIGALQLCGADRLSIYTLNSATGPAAQRARERGIQIVTEDEILTHLRALGLEHFEDLLDPHNKRCPACDGPMKLRTGDFKPFWGCVRFPRCRGKIEVA
jgi:Restriction endonuclease